MGCNNGSISKGSEKIYIGYSTYYVGVTPGATYTVMGGGNDRAWCIVYAYYSASINLQTPTKTLY